MDAQSAMVVSVVSSAVWYVVYSRTTSRWCLRCTLGVISTTGESLLQKGALIDIVGTGTSLRSYTTSNFKHTFAGEIKLSLSIVAISSEAVACAEHSVIPRGTVLSSSCCN